MESTQHQQKSRASGQMFQTHQPVAVTDVVQSFKRFDNEEGTYNIQHGGQNFVATARRGESLECLIPIGVRANTLPQLGSTEPWIVTKISDDRLDLAQAAQQQQGTRDNR